MCLAIPGKIKEISGHEVLVEYPGEARKALVGDDEVKVGDYVMVQMGVVINTISGDEAKVAQEAWKEKSTV